MSEQTPHATQEAFFRFRDRIVNKAHSVERARSWLRALNAMDHNVDLDNNPIEKRLVEDLHLCMFQFTGDAWKPGSEIGWSLWLYADYRRQLRQAICSSYDVSPVPELELWK